MYHFLEFIFIERSQLAQNYWIGMFLLMFIFLQRNQPIDLMEMIEKYVLICAENEKLSFGFIEKL